MFKFLTAVVNPSLAKEIYFTEAKPKAKKSCLLFILSEYQRQIDP